MVEAMHEIPVIMSADNNYAAFLYAAVSSLIACNMSGRNYRIYILDGGVTVENRQAIQRLATDDCGIEFIDVSRVMQRYDQSLFTLNLHFTLATYYRFFLSELFPHYSRVIYLDCDMLVCQDIAGLYDLPLDGYYLAAAPDAGVISASRRLGAEYRDYFHQVLGLDNIENYFQAGCMVINLDAMRADNIQQKFIDCLARVKNPRYVDQCIMNSVCQGRVYFIDLKWNYLWHHSLAGPTHFAEVCEGLPPSLREQFVSAKANPVIIHFSGGGMKPEAYPAQPEAVRFLERFAGLKNTHPLRVLIDRNIRRFREKNLQKDQKMHIRFRRYRLLAALTFGTISKKFGVKRQTAKEMAEILDASLIAADTWLMHNTERSA